MKKRLIKIILLNTLIVIISLIYYYLNKYFNIGIPCLFYQITGLKCPGCGITRLIFSLIKLDFNQAFFYNPYNLSLYASLLKDMLQDLQHSRKELCTHFEYI